MPFCFALRVLFQLVKLLHLGVFLFPFYTALLVPSIHLLFTLSPQSAPWVTVFFHRMRTAKAKDIGINKPDLREFTRGIGMKY